MDPLTAFFNMVAALLHYLATPVGQVVAKDNHARLEKFLVVIDKLWDRIVDRLTASVSIPGQGGQGQGGK